MSVTKALNSGEAISLDEIEHGFRAAALHDGNILFTKFLSEMEVSSPECPKCSSTEMRNQGSRSKNIVSLLGEGTISRDYYSCRECGSHAIPKDKILDIEGTSFTPGVRRVVAKLAACDSFENSSTTLEELCGIFVSSKDTERIAHTMGTAIETEKVVQIEDTFSLQKEPLSAKLPTPIMYIEYDGTGVPVMKREVFGRKGKQEDGTAKTREAKLGCIFTQTNTNEDGEPVRDKKSTTYFGAIEASDAFSRRLYMEAVNRGVESAEKVVVLGDGAKWIWNLAKDNFPSATQIVDYYHAKKHLSDFIKAVFVELICIQR
jgi:DNA-directed RNA polymerase subunit RPC12/RpoP